MKILTFFFLLFSPLWIWAQVGPDPLQIKQPDSLLRASPSDALIYADEMLRSKFAENDCQIKGATLNLKGRALSARGRFDEALAVLRQAESVNRRCRSDTDLAVSLISIAKCQMDDPESSYTPEEIDSLFRNEALPLALRLKDTAILAKIYINLAKNWGDNEQPRKALDYNLRCENLLGSDPRSPHVYLRGINRIGLGNRLLDLYYENEDSVSLQQVGEHYYKAIEDIKSFKDNGALGLLADAQNGLGGVKLYLDDLPEAERYFKESLETCKQISDVPRTANALYNLSILAESRNEFLTAIDTLEAAHLLTKNYKGIPNSIMEDQLSGSQYEDRKVLLRSQHRARQLERFQYALLGGGAFLFLALIAGFFFNRQRMRSRHLLLEQQQKTELKEMENRLQQREITFVREKIDAEAAERVRIARKLHDDVGGKLISTKWGLETIIKELPIDSDLAKKLKENLQQQEESYQAARTVSHQLKGSITRWWEYLEEFCARLGNGHTKIEFSTHNLNESVIGPIGETARLAVQELVINALKSAQAKEISVQIDLVGSVLSILVRDDGKGFDLQTVAPGIGLSNIRERVVEEMGGSFEIDSTIGVGTTIFVDIPIGPTDALDKNLLKFDDNDE